ncbi:MAG: hypothetical protein OXN16_11195 [Gammaproteobacteria bacterium]|nr:hypothetical protein [Gammaproteobacteria bacterium]MDE0714825.1 hypothetical protein [Gammaproteobacteria bacterium]
MPDLFTRPRSERGLRRTVKMGEVAGFDRWAVAQAAVPDRGSGLSGVHIRRTGWL